MSRSFVWSSQPQQQQQQQQQFWVSSGSLWKLTHDVIYPLVLWEALNIVIFIWLNLRRSAHDVFEWRRFVFAKLWRMEGPQDGEEYSVQIGDSIKDASSTDAVQCSFRYDFQPASVDTTVCGLVTVASNAVVVEMAHANAAGGIEFKGKITDNKEVECVLIFDPEKKTFVLEKLPLSCTQLRHVRKSTRAIQSKK